MSKVRSRVDVIPAEDVLPSAIYVTMDMEVPEGFWDDPDPSPKWLSDIYFAFVNRGWGHNATQSIYSFYNDPIEEVEDSPDLMRFWIWLDGDYLVENPRILEDLDRLRDEGIVFQEKGRKRWGKETYRVVDWRISGDRGPLHGGEWGPNYFHDYFVVKGK